MIIKLPIPPPKKTALQLIRGERRWGDLKKTERLPVLKLIAENGSLPALHLALEVMKEDADEKSKWIVEGALRIFADRVMWGFTTGKGQSGNERARHRGAMKRFNRWRAVKKLREQNFPWDKAYCEAEQSLKKGQGKAEPDTIRKSYKRVQMDMESIDTAAQYFAGLEEFRYLVGIDKFYPGDKLLLGNE